MNIFYILKRIYMEMFSWAFESETDIDRMFVEFDKFHGDALPESESPIESFYAKFLKTKWFKLASPIVYMYLKFLAMKYSNTEYLQRLVEKSIDGDN